MDIFALCVVRTCVVLVHNQHLNNTTIELRTVHSPLFFSKIVDVDGGGVNSFVLPPVSLASRYQGGGPSK